MKISKRVYYSITLALGASSFINPAVVLADDEARTTCVEWKKLSLSAPQSQQIQSLEQDWNSKYMKLQPDILEHQRKLAKLLMDPKSDPLEIMSTNQRIAHLKEQLRNEAVTNYLKKRAVLNSDQQHQLEGMMSHMIATRQQLGSPAPQTEEQGGFMDIIHKVNWMMHPYPEQK